MLKQILRISWIKKEENNDMGENCLIKNIMPHKLECFGHVKHYCDLQTTVTEDMVTGETCQLARTWTQGTGGTLGMTVKKGKELARNI